MDQEKQFIVAAGKLFDGDMAPMENPLFNIGVDLLSEFAEAQMLRLEAETRWLQDLRQYKGVYEPDEESRMRGSKAFLRKTRVKVESVDARMMDLLFPASREKNYEVDATPEPSVPPETRQRITGLLRQMIGSVPDEAQIKEAIRQHVKSAASKMAARIDDQLTEAKYRNVSREVMHSGHLYGTGILKGPLVERSIRTRYNYESGKYLQVTESFVRPFLSHVPIWRFYPDMTVTDIKDCRYVWEHHRLGASDLVSLSERSTFDAARIRDYMSTHPEGNIKLMRYEQELRSIRDSASNTLLTKNTGQFDVYERWGWLSGEKLESCGVCVPEGRRHEQFFSNIWMLPDGVVIKAVLAPINGVTWPYHMYYLEKDETSIFGDGYPAIMRDDQKIINAAGRMLLDNAAITSGPQFEVYLPAFPAGADVTSIFPGKIWPRVGGDMQYPAVRQLNFNAHLKELADIMQIFDAAADETTAVPKFSYGDNPQNGAAATMGGLSMLLGQANIALKDQVISYDEGITRPFIEAMYHWNMMFSADKDIKGDFDVKARGASSLVAKEVRGQAVAMFAASLQPEERALIKWDALCRQKAEAHDLVDVVKTEEEMESEQQSMQENPQAQMAQMMAQLEMERKRAEIAEMAAKSAETETKTLAQRVNAMRDAIDAAAVVVANPAISSAVDSMLASAGWKEPAQEPQAPAMPAQEGQVMLADGGAVRGRLIDDASVRVAQQLEAERASAQMREAALTQEIAALSAKIAEVSDESEQKIREIEAKSRGELEKAIANAEVKRDIEIEKARMAQETAIRVAEINNEATARVSAMQAMIERLASEIEGVKQAPQPVEQQPINLNLTVDASKSAKRAGKIVPDGSGGFSVVAEDLTETV